MSYKRKYPLVFEFLTLGKATKMANHISKSPALSQYFSTFGPKTILLEFDSNEDKELFKSRLMKNAMVKRLVRTNQMIIT